MSDVDYNVSSLEAELGELNQKYSRVPLRYVLYSTTAGLGALTAYASITSELTSDRLVFAGITAALEILASGMMYVNVRDHINFRRERKEIESKLETIVD